MHILSCAPALRVCVMKLAVGWHLKRTDTSFHLAEMAKSLTGTGQIDYKVV